MSAPKDGRINAAIVPVLAEIDIITAIKHNINVQMFFSEEMSRVRCYSDRIRKKLYLSACSVGDCGGCVESVCC